MQIAFDCVPTLPKLAWLATVDLTTSLVSVAHGSGVETAGTFFVEGAWDGPFAEGDFANTACLFGTGGGTDGADAWFASSTATTDYLYYHSTPQRVSVANSLPLLLASRRVRLDPMFDGYDAINESIMRGINGYLADIPTTADPIRRLMHRNLRVSQSGVVERDKDLPPPFPTFEAYYEYLSAAYGRIASNARDAARRRALAIYSTQSRGYDTTAVNAIAARHGVDKAFTVTRGKKAGSFVDREEGEAPNDDGTQIAAALGIPSDPIERRAFAGGFATEDLYYACLDQNQDFNMHQMTERMDRVGLLLTGTLGELWYSRQSYEEYMRRYDLIDDTLKRVDLGGHGLAEVRLEVGFIQAAVPYIGARRRPDIFAITESDAMDPWRLKNHYDRPIPRRIAETAGLPRSMFGQTKIASVVQFSPPALPIGESLRSAYFDFLIENRLLAPWQLRLFPVVHRVNSILWFAGEGRHAWIHYAQRAISKVLRRDYRFSLWWQRLSGRLFCFCVNRRADQLFAALRSAAPDARTLSPP
ncbi:MAG TPA: hypothetical protein VN650_07450 [Gemmatimonadaceae bacterium]|nr:hypothetical protein [Gemmatimonadaceae bacterium]